MVLDVVVTKVVGSNVDLTLEDSTTTDCRAIDGIGVDVALSTVPVDVAVSVSAPVGLGSWGVWLVLGEDVDN